MSQYQSAQLVMMMLLMNSANFFILSNVRIVGGKQSSIIGMFIILAGLSLISTRFLIFLAFSINQQDILFYLTLIIIAALLCHTAFSGINKSSNKKGVLLIIIVVAGILYVTVLSRFGLYKPYIKLDLFYSIKQMMYHHSLKRIKHLFANIVLFIPLGFAFPMLQHNKISLFGYTMIGTMFSAGIESTQLILAIGECDVGDVFGNSIGMLLGVISYNLAKKIF